MEDMFNGCECLTYLDVSGFNTHKVDNMGRMFYYDRKLMSLDVSNFDTSNVRDMRAMFYECERLTSLDVSGFDTSHVLDMSHMFDGCQSLTSLDVSGFDTSHVLYMEYMFNWCKKLTSLNVRNFNTSIVEDICGIFEGCVNLKELDLSGFDMGAIDEREEDMKDMLSSCIGLATIYTPYNLSYSITLPKDKEADKWYQSDGTVITELPQKLNYSVKIARNSIPVIDNPYIMAQKTKTVYVCGDTLNMEDLTVKYYDVDGTVKEVSGYTTNADTIDMSTAGTKTLIITYNNLTAEIELTVTDALPGLTYTITFDLCGHGVQIAPLTGIAAGSLIMEPQSPVAEGYSFMGWYKDSAYNYVWDFKKDTVQENLTLYAYWMQAEDSTQIGNVLLQRIPAQIYTGSAVKPTVKVYYQSNGMKTLLKAGMDYTVKYYNNIQADTEQEKTLGGTSHTDTGNGFTKDLAYIVITCKGNYTGTVYQNFHINPVSIAEKGFTLSWTEQLISGTKALKPFSSLKYKKVMKAGTDYTIRITAQNAYDANGNALSEGKIIDGNSKFPNIPAGYRGTFLMTITGINNYKGMITKTIYVTDKNHLMKNASVSLGKNLKSIKYTGDLITLTPAWYDISDQKYYIMDENGKSIETDKNNVFTVKLGTEYLVYGKDFKISYQSNLAVGTATMTITGTGDYIGTKNVTFRITGTAFNTHNIRISNLSATLIYTGKALEQNKIVLTDISGIKPNELICGTDYTIHYKNNIKKGTATMILTANPLSGYSGSFKQSFKITAADLSEITNVTAADLYNDTIIAENGNIQFEGKIIYTKEGAKPSGRIVLINRNTNNILQEGTDYKVSYRNNKAITTNSSLAIMIIKGKGNYTGSIIINFPIVKASLSENNNMTVVAASISYNSKKAESYQYQPKIKITDKKKVLSVAKDYEVVEYKNCTQTAVEAYLEALANDAATVGIRPYAIIKARDGSGYEGSIEVNLTIYQTKLTTKNLYIIVSAETEQITYTGKQVRPEVTVYYGKNEAIKQAKAVGETKEYILTDRSGKYKLTKLSSSENGTGDYTLEYGTNIIAGKNKGSVTVNGAGLYGGKVTVKFTILGKNVHNVKRL